MKKNYFFLLITLFLTFPATAQLQGITIIAKNIKIDSVLNEICKQGHYSYMCDPALLGSFSLDISVQNVTAGEVLNLCFKYQPFSYTIDGPMITIISKKAVLPSKNRGEILNHPNVTGRVFNNKGEPLPNATVLVKGTMQSTVTNELGEFVLTGVDVRSAWLLISYVGYETQEIKLTDSIYVRVQLKPNEEELDAVISTGYQELRKSTGSAGKVKNEVIGRGGGDMVSRINGNVAGLIINNSLNTSGISSISIRSISTLESDQSPLFVVDNFPLEPGEINSINPNDVESISVLKDAAAASIWGAKAGNGVVVLTLKRGKYNQPTNLLHESVLTVTGMPRQPIYYSTNDFIKHVEQPLFNNGFYDDDLKNSSSFPVISKSVIIMHQRREGLISAADSAMQMDELIKTSLRNELQKHVYRAGIRQQHFLSLGQGNNTINYRAAAGYMKNSGVVKGQGDERVNVNLKLASRVARHIELNGGIYFTTQRATHTNLEEMLSPASGGKSNAPPHTKLTDKYGNRLSILKGYSNEFKAATDLNLLHSWDYIFLDELDNKDDQTKTTNLLANLGLKARIVTGLTMEVRYQFQTATQLHSINNSKNSWYTRNTRNNFTLQGQPVSLSAIPPGGIRDMQRSSTQTNYFRAQLSYDTVFNYDHAITIIAGSELSEKLVAYSIDKSYGVADNGLTAGYVDYARPVSTYFGAEVMLQDPRQQSRRKEKFASFYANAIYSYKNKLHFSVSARRDGSNLLGVATNRQFSPFLSSGVAWTISNEPFYKWDWIPELKFRTTIGDMGNVSHAGGGIVTLVEGPVNELAGRTTYEISNPPNPDFSWETVRIFNAGVDFSLKGNRLTGSIDIFQKPCKDLLTRITNNSTFGYTSLFANYSRLRVKGIEVSLDALLIDQAFKWRSVIQAAFQHTRIEKYPHNQVEDFTFAGSSGALVKHEGVDPYSVLSWRSGPLTHLAGDPQGYWRGELSTDYITIKDSTVFGDLVNSGSARPRLFGSLRNTFSWKQWSLSALITYRFLYVFRRTNYINYTTLYENWDQRGYFDFVRRYQQPGDELYTRVPSQPQVYSATDGRDGFYGSSDAVVERGDNIRLEDIRLDYTMNKIKWKKLNFQSASFYLVVTNPGLLYKANKVGLDPEFGNVLPVGVSIGIKIIL